MKKKIILFICLILTVCFLLPGCGKKKEHVENSDGEYTVDTLGTLNKKLFDYSNNRINKMTEEEVYGTDESKKDEHFSELLSRLGEDFFSTYDLEPNSTLTVRGKFKECISAKDSIAVTLVGLDDDTAEIRCLSTDDSFTTLEEGCVIVAEVDLSSSGSYSNLKLISQ